MNEMENIETDAVANVDATNGNNRRRRRRGPSTSDNGHEELDIHLRAMLNVHSQVSYGQCTCGCAGESCQQR
jgi:hypothetical protein